ncbi:AAA family ATPase [Thalassotalea ponticola]|uniref:AAA family ATPase n=1 Tax=Thalassotalea ponticola TaxID=1523392 RepID=UPI0025B48345|nr:AAA family ATPase [Thalassotalea ponticola]MDN3651726.1 AAA family ATPase [Thalassotalea ponticola]
MKNKVRKLSDWQENNKGLSQPKVIKEKSIMSLPVLIESLFVCADPNLRVTAETFLQQIKNLKVSYDSQLNTTNKDYQVVFIAHIGNENETRRNLERASNAGYPIVLIAENISQEIMKQAISLKVQDVLSVTEFEKEAFNSLKKISDEILSQVELAPVISIINGKSGSGASFIANCMAQLVAEGSSNNKNIAVLDGDLQFGTLADSMGFSPDYYLDQALQDADELDSTAVKAMMCHRDNLSLLPVKSFSQLNELSHIDQLQLSQLIHKIRSCYSYLLCDLSRGLERFSFNVLDVSDSIFIVVQQNIVSIRQAKALVKQLTERLGIPKHKISILLNRYSSKYSTIGAKDVAEATGVESVFIIENDHQFANACTDLAKTVKDIANSKVIRQNIRTVIAEATPVACAEQQATGSFWSFFKRDR